MEMELGCAVYGHDGDVFVVTVAREAKVSKLQAAIATILSDESRTLPATKLTLYLARKTPHDEWLKDDVGIEEFLAGDIDPTYTRMPPTWPLDHPELFGPSFDPRPMDIHVLVQQLPPERPRGPGGETRTLNAISSNFPAPSVFACCTGSCGWQAVLKKYKDNIKCHRTLLTSSEGPPTVPIVLYHQVFGRFEHNCSTIKVRGDDCDFVVRFCEAMARGYTCESKLASEARALLQSYLLDDWAPNATLVPTGIQDSVTDGSYFLCNSRLLMNLQVKIQKGCGGGDPTMQNIAYYLKSLEGNSLDRSLPCFLVDLCGPLLSIFGIVNIGDDGVLCEPLLPSFPLLYFDNLSLMTALARAWPPRSIPQSRFPYKDTAVVNGNLVEFRYTETIVRYVFTARLELSKREIVVKFAKRYGREVHQYCADAGFAPRLLDCQVLVNGWVFIVMEKLQLVPLANAPPELKQQVVFQVDQIRNLLACANYVHGDLRETNVLWDSANHRVVLIDFDWAGGHNQVLYPLFMNTNIVWPEGAETNRPILMDHDHYWFDRLLVKL